MSKQVVSALVVLTVLLYAWSLGQWYQSQKAPAARFVQTFPVSSSFHEHEQPLMEEEFIAPSGDIQVHAASIAQLQDGSLAAVWYGGKYEGAPDTQIYFSSRPLHNLHTLHTLNSPETGWLPPRPIVNRASATKELNRYIKTIGNPLLFTDRDNRLQLLFVTVSVGGWSGSSLNIKISTDAGMTWTRSQRLTLSPFFNVAELVRNNPLSLSNGGFVIPIYHECIGIFSELLWYMPGTGDNIPHYFKTRLTWGTRYLQPAMVSTGPTSAEVFYRSHRDDSHVAISSSNNTGKSWTAPQYIDLPNPGSGLNALQLSDNRILLAFNDNPIHRDNLTLAVSNQRPTENTKNTEKQGNEFQTWHRVAVLENTPGEEFSYPYMIRTRDGKIHMVYTWQRKRIKHITFNEAWIEGKITLNAE